MEDKGEILKKLMELKMEFTLKKRKLDKVKRASTVKAHVRQKIKEHENMVRDSDSIQPSISSKDLHVHSHSDASALNCIEEVGQVQEAGVRECTSCHYSGDKLSTTATILQSKDISPIHATSARSCSWLNSDIVNSTRHNRINSSLDENCNLGHNKTNNHEKLKERDKKLMTVTNTTSFGRNLPEKIITVCDSRDCSSNLRSKTQNMRSKQDSSCGNLIQDNEMHTNCKSKTMSKTRSLHQHTSKTLNKDCHSVKNNNVRVLPNIKVHRPLIPSLENKTGKSLTPAVAYGKALEFVRHGRSTTIDQDFKCENGNETESDIQLSSPVNDKGFVDNKSMSIVCVDGRCMNTKMINDNQEKRKETFSGSKNCVLENVQDFVATSNCYRNSQQFVSSTDTAFSTDNTGDPSKRSSSQTDVDGKKNKKSGKEISLNNESDDDLVKGSQMNMAAQRFHICGSRKRMSLITNHFQTISPLTPSFESLTTSLNNNVLKTILSNEPKQEPVTDSEFFNILGLTQTDSKVLRSSGMLDVNVPSPKRQKCETLSVLSETDKIVDLEKLQINNCSKHLSVPGGLQLHCSSTKEKLSDLSAAESSKKNFPQIVPDTEALSSENPFSDYTELDAIPYSQFELTEDFLSETQHSQEAMKVCSNRGKSSGALVMRRSSRISSFCFTQSNSLSLTASSLSPHSTNVDCALPKVVSKKRRSLALQKKVAAILSVFQFLIDEARKTSSSTEFELPKLFDTLKRCRIESTVKTSYFFEAQVIVGNENEKTEIDGECTRNTNNVLCSKNILNQKDVDRASPCSCKRDTETSHNVTAKERSADARDKQDVMKEDENIDLCTDMVHDFICNSGTTGDSSVKKQQTKSSEDQEISYVFLTDTKMTSGIVVDEYLLDNNNSNKDLIYNITDVKSSNSLKTGSISDKDTPSLRRKNMRVSKLRRKLFNSSIGKTAVKSPFAVKSAIICPSLHASSDKTPGGRETVISGTHSADTKVLSVESVSHPKYQDGEMSITFFPQINRDSSCPIKETALLQNKTSSTRPESPETIYETPRTHNTLSTHSPNDSFQKHTTTSEQLLHPFKDNASVMTAHINQPNMDSTQTPSISVHLRSPHMNSSLPVTPVFEKCHHQSSSQISRGFSLTSTPKAFEACGTWSTPARPDFDISFNDCERSEKLNTSVEVSLKRTVQHFPHSNLTPSRSQSVPSDLSIALNNEMETLDESYLSPAQIPINTDNLYVKAAPAVKESPVDVSLISSGAERSNVSQNEVSGLFVTFRNVITPWKKLSKTALTPVLVMEKDDNKASLGTPVFSSVTKRSRTKFSSCSGTTSRNVLRFSGCFQSCTQDAVVSLLSGVLKTKDNELKNYIVIVQATSLTVWTEDELMGWTAELDWRLSSEIHVMKACLLPRNDAVIAVVASGWDKKNLFTTLFVYDWSSEDTVRFNIPLLEQQNELKSPTQIELCPFLASKIHIAITSHTHHTVGTVIFTDSLRAVQSLSMFGVHRGKLINFVAVKGQLSANVSLTRDQEVSIWNMKIGIILKQIKLQSYIPCLTGLLAASSYKGILLLDTIWRVDDGECGGVIAVNPLTGHTKKMVAFSAPNNTWRSIESAKSGETLVTAVSDKGSLAVWDRKSGALLGYTRSKVTTCASQLDKHLIVGEIHGCLHIYSAAN